MITYFGMDFGHQGCGNELVVSILEFDERHNSIATSFDPDDAADLIPWHLNQILLSRRRFGLRRRHYFIEERCKLTELDLRGSTLRLKASK